MQIIKQNPVIAAILGGLAVMVLLVAVLSGGGNSGSDLPTSDLPTATGTAFNPFAQATTEAARADAAVAEVACADVSVGPCASRRASGRHSPYELAACAQKPRVLRPPHLQQPPPRHRCRCQLRPDPAPCSVCTRRSSTAWA